MAKQSGKRNKNKQRRIRVCHNCSCCVYIGEGDYICDRGVPFIVMEDHCPSDFYCACKDPKLYEEAQQRTLALNEGGDEDE